MPAAVYWFGGLALAHGSHGDLGADAGRVHDAADAALLPGRLAARRRPRRADLARALRPDLRVPRPAGRHRRARGRRARSAAPATSSFDDVWFRYGDDAWTLEDVSLHGARRARRPRSSARRAPARRRSATSPRGSTTSSEGSVSIGGVDVRDLSFASLARLGRRRLAGDLPLPRDACARTCASRSPTRPTRRSRRPPRRRGSTT